MLLTVATAIAPSAASAGPVPSRRGDEAPQAALPGRAGPSDPLPREELASAPRVLLEPRVRGTKWIGLDLTFAELGWTVDDPFRRDW